MPLIQKPTCITHSSATLIDNIFTNYCDLSIESGTLFSDISNHLPIFQITLKGGLSKLLTLSEVLIPILSRNFYSCLQHVNWETLCMMISFKTKFWNLYNNYFPIRRASGNTKKLKPWMSNGILNSIKYKNKLYKKFLVKPTNLNRNR